MSHSDNKQYHVLCCCRHQRCNGLKQPKKKWQRKRWAAVFFTQQHQWLTTQMHFCAVIPKSTFNFIHFAMPFRRGFMKFSGIPYFALADEIEIVRKFANFNERSKTKRSKRKSEKVKMEKRINCSIDKSNVHAKWQWQKKYDVKERRRRERNWCNAITQSHSFIIGGKKLSLVVANCYFFHAAVAQSTGNTNDSTILRFWAHFFLLLSTSTFWLCPVFNLSR